MAVTKPSPATVEASKTAGYLERFGTPGALIFMAVTAAYISGQWLDAHMKVQHALTSVSQMVPAVSDAQGGWDMSVPPQTGLDAKRIGVWWRSGTAEGFSVFPVPAEGDWTWSVAYPPGPTGAVTMRLYIEDADGVDYFGKTFSRTRP